MIRGTIDPHKSFLFTALQRFTPWEQLYSGMLRVYHTQHSRNSMLHSRFKYNAGGLDKVAEYAMVGSRMKGEEGMNTKRVECFNIECGFIGTDGKSCKRKAEYEMIYDSPSAHTIDRSCAYHIGELLNHNIETVPNIDEIKIFRL